MCMFSGDVREVSGTSIYAARLADGYQRLVYAMSVEHDADVAMVLPVPTPPGSAEDVVRFVDLSSCATFFDNLAALFEPPAQAASRGLRPAALAVHTVGDFDASFVPTAPDFDRLDERFRLPADVGEQLPQYADWGFCVFKLRATDGHPARHHPMAFDFPHREGGVLHFPTMHVHDGQVHAEADFDHRLYAQVPIAPPGWDESRLGVQALVPAVGTFLQPDLPLVRTVMRGTFPNRDVSLVTR